MICSRSSPINHSLPAQWLIKRERTNTHLEVQLIAGKLKGQDFYNEGNILDRRLSPGSNHLSSHIGVIWLIRISQYSTSESDMRTLHYFFRVCLASHQLTRSLFLLASPLWQIHSSASDDDVIWPTTAPMHSRSEFIRRSCSFWP